MEFTNSFSVKAPIDRVWVVMISAEEVAPCVPGAQITEAIDGTHYKGTVKVKLGAVQMTYRGELEMQPDEASHTIVLTAKGTETRGSGGASGVITNRLSEPEPGVTHVEIHSRVDVTGRVAQFGRGIMQDVANRLIREFAKCLESKLSPQVETSETDTPREASSGPSSEATAVTPPTSAPTPRPQVEPKQAEIRPLSLLADVARARLATLLRAAAKKIEPQ
jgi:uncharacterized protein